MRQPIWLFRLLQLLLPPQALVFFAMLLMRFSLNALLLVRIVGGRRLTPLGISSHVFCIVFHVSLTDGSLRLCIIPLQSLSEREKFTVPLSTCLPSQLSNKAWAFTKASSWGSCSIPFVTLVGVAAMIGFVLALSPSVPLFTIVNGGCELQAQALLIKSTFVCSNKLTRDVSPGYQTYIFVYCLVSHNEACLLPRLPHP